MPHGDDSCERGGTLASPSASISLARIAERLYLSRSHRRAPLSLSLAQVQAALSSKHAEMRDAHTTHTHTHLHTRARDELTFVARYSPQQGSTQKAWPQPSAALSTTGASMRQISQAKSGEAGTPPALPSLAAAARGRTGGPGA